MDALTERLAIYAIAVPKEILWGLLPGKCLDHLLRCPLGGRMLRSDTILLDRRLGDVNPPLAELAHDAWGAPSRISLPHRADEIADVFGNG
jgi:hypothetical protein